MKIRALHLRVPQITLLTVSFATFFALTQVHAQTAGEMRNADYHLYAEITDRGAGKLLSVRLTTPATLADQPIENDGLTFNWKAISPDGLTAYEGRQELNDASVHRLYETVYLTLPLPSTERTLKCLLSISTASGTVGRPIGLEVQPSDAALPFYFATESETPIVHRYAKAGDRLRLEGGQPGQTAYVLRFDHSFLPAAPPDAYKGSRGEPGLEVASVTPVQMGASFVVEQPGLYFAQADTSTTVGVALTVVPADYPKMKKLSHVLPAVTYISKQSEMSALMRASDAKEAFDKYWLALIGTQDIARETIREYYRRVTQANEQFTTYKEGWKTDRGIVYVIFGRPDERRFIGEQVEWVYNAGRRDEFLFVFDKRKTIFTDNGFRLLRDASYSKRWENAVEAWRRGAVR